MCDIQQTNMVFALKKAEYQRFKKVYLKFQFMVDNIPETDMVNVFQLREIEQDTYELLDLVETPYQIKKIYLIIPCKIEKTKF